jgi:prolyl 4-hydroxylase
MIYLKNILLIIVVLISIYLLYSFNIQTFINNTEVTTKKLSKYEEIILSKSPKIIYIKNFLPEDDLINHFILLSNKLKKASTVDTKNNPTTILKDVRTSESAHLGKSTDKFIKILENRACEYVDLPTSHLEPMQVVVYKKGQKYNPHYDFFSDGSTEISKGNRNKTVLVYLNDLPENSGGCTIFPIINLKVKPKKGDAIYFENMNGSNVDYNTLHAGEEIFGNYTKYAINIWFREKPIYT